MYITIILKCLWSQLVIHTAKPWPQVCEWTPACSRHMKDRTPWHPVVKAKTTVEQAL